MKVGKTVGIVCSSLQYYDFLHTRWARRRAACSLRLTRRSWGPSTAASNPGPNHNPSPRPAPIPNPNPSPNPIPIPSPHPNPNPNPNIRPALAPDEPSPTPNQVFYSNLSREGREGYDAILSTSISKVLSSVTFIAEAQLDDTALRNCGELCSYLPLRPGALVFEQACEYLLLLRVSTYCAERPRGFFILTTNRAIQQTPFSSC